MSDVPVATHTHVMSDWRPIVLRSQKAHEFQTGQGTVGVKILDEEKLDRYYRTCPCGLIEEREPEAAERLKLDKLAPVLPGTKPPAVPIAGPVPGQAVRPIAAGQQVQGQQTSDKGKEA